MERQSQQTDETVDLDKERTSLTAIHNFVKNTQALQDKIQLHIQETMQEAQRCLKMAIDMENNINGLSQNKRTTIVQPYCRSREQECKLHH